MTAYPTNPFKRGQSIPAPQPSFDDEAQNFYDDSIDVPSVTAPFNTGKTRQTTPYHDERSPQPPSRTKVVRQPIEPEHVEEGIERSPSRLEGLSHTIPVDGTKLSGAYQFAKEAGLAWLIFTVAHLSKHIPSVPVGIRASIQNVLSPGVACSIFLAFFLIGARQSLIPWLRSFVDLIKWILATLKDIAWVALSLRFWGAWLVAYVCASVLWR